jgi:hypothetical protein
MMIIGFYGMFEIIASTGSLKKHLLGMPPFGGSIF